MNTYTVNVYHNDVDRPYTFRADTLKNAYIEAGRLIIDNYSDYLSDDSCALLDAIDRDTWDSYCQQVFELDDIDISDIQELDE